MIEDGDKIAIGISGGKDSLTLLYALAGMRKFYPKKYDVVAITVDTGVGNMDFSKVKELCESLNVPYEIIPTQIFPILMERQEKRMCPLCAKLRKGAFNEAALRLGCNKIALGHHFDDVVETILMSLIFNGEFKTMMPKLHSDNFEGIELIRPLYLVKEESIISWRNTNELTFINCACRFTEGCSLINDGTSKRKEMKELIKNLRKINKNADYNIFKSLDNVNLDCVLGTKTNGVYKSFLEDYDKKDKNK